MWHAAIGGIVAGQPARHFKEHSTLARHNRLAMLFLMLCATIVLVPTPLLEFRYFVIPVLLFKVRAECYALWVAASVVMSVFSYFWCASCHLKIVTWCR